MSKEGNTKVTVKCIKCGNEREITRQQIRRSKYTGLCADCSRASRKGVNHPCWKGGTKLGGQDSEYMMVHKPTHPQARANGYVMQHRLVAEDMLGRYLTPEEVPHHLNEDTRDNRFTNIIVLADQSSHAKLHKYLEQTASMVRADERAKTLKEVGEWLREHIHGTLDVAEWEALKKGEMP